MTYDEARAAHAAGHAVSCGLGIRPPGCRWNELLDLAAELTSSDWCVLGQAWLKDTIAAAPGRNPQYLKNARGFYERT